MECIIVHASSTDRQADTHRYRHTTPHLFLIHTYTDARMHARTHTHTHSLSLSHSPSHTHTYTHAQTLESVRRERERERERELILHSDVILLHLYSESYGHGLTGSTANPANIKY